MMIAKILAGLILLIVMLAVAVELVARPPGPPRDTRWRWLDLEGQLPGDDDNTDDGGT